MGSTVISEVQNDIPPWSSMIDSRSHRSGQVSYDISSPYRPTAPAAQTQSHRRNTSQSSRTAASSTSSSTATQPLQTLEIPTRTTTTSSTAKDAPTKQEPINQSSASPRTHHEARPTPPKSSRLAAASPPGQHMSSTSPNNHPGPDSGPQSDSSVSSPQHASATNSPVRIKVRDLQHIQTFAVEGTISAASAAGSEQGNVASPQYEISDMPIGDIIEMVAGLLTKITATNDQHYEHLHRQIPPPEAAASMSSQTSSVLAFHGKNVPSITILSYLSRIHKYCPATWEVFLSLLVYFDRMTERVNAGPIQSLRQADEEYMLRSARGSQLSMAGTDHSLEAGDASITGEQSTSNTTHQVASSKEAANEDETNLSHFFVVDSFNIHRLVIAGVTCAAKYFSDIFFTNSRYAKVGGLPLVELNNLELQFLVLNDFRLAVPVEELEAYATMLVEFYAREIVTQRQSDNPEAIEMVTR